MGSQPTIRLDLRSELKPDKLPFIGISAEWTRKLNELLGGVSTEITVAATWAQATIKWRGEQFVILMTSTQGGAFVDYLDCTVPGNHRKTTLKQHLWVEVFQPVLERVTRQTVAEWEKKLEAITNSNP